MIKGTTFNFLKQIAIHNDRNWFQGNKDQYNLAREDVLDFTSKIIIGLSKADPAIPADLIAPDCLMRIYRDVRFSKDKSPYKTNFGIAISPNGKNFNGPGYYIHLQPEQSFIAAGSWMPSPDHLKAIRQEIDYNGEIFRKIIKDPSFKKYFGDMNTEDKLKTSPKGYPADHPDIEYLKLKSFTVSHHIKDEELIKAGAVESVMNIFKKVNPLMVFLRNAVA